MPSELPTKADSIIGQINRISMSQDSHAYRLIDELAAIADKENNQALEVQVLYCKAATDYLQGKIDTSMVSRAQALLKEKNSSMRLLDKALLQLSLSMNYTTESKYADAFQQGLMALEIFEQQKEAIYTARTYFILGNICTYIKSYKLAENYYDEALKHVKSNQFEYCQIKLNRAKLFFYTQKTTIAIDSMSAIIPEIIRCRDTGLLAAAYLNLATCYVMNNAADSASHYYNTILELFKTIDNNKLRFTLYQSLGLYYFYTSDSKKSFDYFYLSKQIAVRDDNPEQLLYAFYNLGFLYDKAGRVDSSLFYYKKYIEVNNQLTNHSGAIEAYQAYVSVFLEASKDKLTIAEQEIKLKNRRFTALTIATIAIILLATLLFVIFQQIKRQQAIVKEAEKKDLETRLEHEQKLKQLQTKRHKEGLDAKVREITSYSLLLSNKNQLLQQIATIVKCLPPDQPEVAEINNIIKNNLNTEQAWGDFMLHFQKIHPRFFQRLKSLPCAKQITENELRLCAYFRIGMSTKQIAQILNVSPESVRIHRYRLKKKLDLNEEQDLDDFIRNI